MDALNLCDFGIRPGTDGDASPAFAMALAACRDRRAGRLRIEPGIYHLRNARAEALMHRVLSGELGHNPEKAMFHPNHRDYAVGVDASGLRDVRIEAEGAVLMCHGFMEPLRLARPAHQPARRAECGRCPGRADKPWTIWLTATSGRFRRVLRSVVGMGSRCL
jgi:hypothetical protein